MERTADDLKYQSFIVWGRGLAGVSVTRQRGVQASETWPALPEDWKGT